MTVVRARQLLVDPQRFGDASHNFWSMTHFKGGFWSNFRMVLGAGRLLRLRLNAADRSSTVCG
jgi:hypothetical protein